MATREDRLMAWRMFKCTASVANAAAFQALFWDVMKAKYGQSFAAVAPQGSRGDGGNDGYHPETKHYYQVFAPVAPREKATGAASKLKKDFAKVKEQWGGNAGPGLLKFSFAFNDKYQGAPKEIELALNALRATHAGIAFAQYCCRELEADFMDLAETDWERVLGGTVPHPAQVTALDYSVLTEVIRHVMCADVADSESRLDLPPELDRKIALTGLGKVNAISIQSGALLTGHIEKYFDAHSKFALDELRDQVVGVYEAAKRVIAEEASRDQASLTDPVFALFRRSLFPKHSTAATGIAVDAVIGYFFEACDVFDPNAAKDLPGAAP